MKVIFFFSLTLLVLLPVQSAKAYCTPDGAYCTQDDPHYQARQDAKRSLETSLRISERLRIMRRECDLVNWHGSALHMFSCKTALMSALAAAYTSSSPRHIVIIAEYLEVHGDLKAALETYMIIPRDFPDYYTKYKYVKRRIFKLR